MKINEARIDLDIIMFNISEGNYRYIGSGSGRRVFDLGNGYVVKYAKNKKGIAQNEAEHQIFSTDHSNLFAKITQVSADFQLLIMEKAEPLNHLSDVWRYYNVTSNRGLFQLEEINYVFSKYKLLQKDLCRPANWGIINNRPVIIDYGFTRRVKRKYYLPF